MQNAQTPKLDGRQRLPSVFAARWLRRGVNGSHIWPEGSTGHEHACGSVPVLNLDHSEEEGTAGSNRVQINTGEEIPRPRS